MSSCHVCGCSAPVAQPVRAARRAALVPSAWKTHVHERKYERPCASSTQQSSNKRAKPSCLHIHAASGSALTSEDSGAYTSQVVGPVLSIIATSWCFIIRRAAAALLEKIDRAADILNSMMEEIHREAFVSSAVSELIGQPLVSQSKSLQHVLIAVGNMNSIQSRELAATLSLPIVIVCQLCSHRTATRCDRNRGHTEGCGKQNGEA